MKNISMSNINKKDVDHFTTIIGLLFRKKLNKIFKKIRCSFSNTNIKISTEYVPLESYNINEKRNNIILEGYPKLIDDEPYIFLYNSGYPKDINTVLNIIDRNAYLLLDDEELLNNFEKFLLYLNGVISFNSLDINQSNEVIEKISKVLKTNSVLVNLDSIVDSIFAGIIKTAIHLNRRIILISLIRDNNISFIDVGNPIDVTDINVNLNRDFISNEEADKYYINNVINTLQDTMGASINHMVKRHSLRDDCLDTKEEVLSLKTLNPKANASSAQILKKTLRR